MLLSLENVTKYYGGTLILDHVNLKLEDSDRVGLIGVNGAGKSTLLNIIIGDLDADEGVIARTNGKTFGFLRQNSGLSRGNTIGQELRSVFSHLLALEEEMRRVEGEMASLSDHSTGAYHDLAQRYAAMQAEFEAGDGYQIDVKINTILNGMGFAGRDRDTLIDNLSGGEKTRLALCKLLLEAPDLLILDEPTNHLDFKTLIWLEEYLKTYKGGLLIVSHDRYFLDSLVTSVCEIEYHKLVRYPGNYTKYVALKDERLERQQKEYDQQQAEIARLQEYVDKNIVRATTAKSAKSKRKAIEHMELVEKPNPPVKSAKMRFTYELEPVKDVLHVSDLSIGVGWGESAKVLFESLSLDVMRGEKIALIGANGVGKSSLLKAVQGLIPVRHGRVEWGKNTKIAYYEQEDILLNSQKTVLDELWDRYPHMLEVEVRTVLGNVLIRGEDCYKLVSDLSGGEKAKLKFAIMMLQHANVLILDEPTNHLDLMSKEVLDKALGEYTGTVILVSHDRYLLNKFPTKIIEMFPDRLVSYSGRYEEYVEKKREQAAFAAASRPVEKKEEKPETSYHRTKRQRSEDAARKRKIAQLEERIAAAEEEIAALEAGLADPEIAGDYQKLQEHCALLEEKRVQLAADTDAWCELVEG